MPRVLEVFKRFDALITPTQPNVAPKAGRLPPDDGRGRGGPPPHDGPSVRSVQPDGSPGTHYPVRPLIGRSTGGLAGRGEALRRGLRPQGGELGPGGRRAGTSRAPQRSRKNGRYARYRTDGRMGPGDLAAQDVRPDESLAGGHVLNNWREIGGGVARGREDAEGLSQGSYRSGPFRRDVVQFRNELDLHRE